MQRIPVENHTAKVMDLPPLSSWKDKEGNEHKAHGPVSLIPGTNHVSAIYIDRLVDLLNDGRFPVVFSWINRGRISFGDEMAEEGAPDHVPPFPDPIDGPIRDCTVAELEIVVSQEDRVDLLRAWLDIEKRSTGREAIERRIRELEADK